jgi:Tfp pilus assembly PilM family ATPase
MARSCGIRIGPRRFELVVLDGSARKHRLTAFMTGEFDAGDDSVRAAVVALKEAVKAHNVPADSTSIAIDSGLAAFRTLKLPALDEAKIEEVIKFEVESELPQWNVDDVVVDFMTLEQTDSESNLLVTAVPKSDIARAIDLCADAGAEPQEVELEATAMVNAALAADICHVDDAQVLVHIGEHSSAVVVMDGGNVRSMRAIHIGALTHEPSPAAPFDGEEEGEERAVPEVDLEQEQEDAERRLEQAVSRIRRELGRTLSAARTANPVDAIYVCGWELPDLVETTLQDIPIYELDVFEADSGQPAEGAAPLVVAYGVALRGLGGGVIQSRLRREELRFTGAFERVELPLAVAALMLVTLLGVFVIFELKQVKLRKQDVNLWLQSAVNFMYGVPKEGKPGNLDRGWDSLDSYTDKVRNAPDQLEHTRLEQLAQVERMLNLEIARLNEDLGNTGEVMQPQSSLEALARVVGVIDDLGEEVGRVAVRKAQAQTRHGSFGAQENVEVRLDLSFFAENAGHATGNYERFKSALSEQPWVVGDPIARGTTEFDGGGGIFTDDMRITCDLSLIPRNQPGQVAQSSGPEGPR